MAQLPISVGISMVVRFDLQADVARLAEDLGYDGLWFPEHLIWPAAFDGQSPYDDGHPPVDPRIPTLDVLMWMVTIAQVTSRIRLGTFVYNLSLRHPFVAARAVQTLDIISGGRVDFGVGAGWSQREYEATGVTFKTRGRRLEECIEVCRDLWTKDPVTHDGEQFAFGPVHFFPKPVQARVPILIGGNSDAALARAGRVGDGWIGMTDTPAATAERVAKIGSNVQIVTGGDVSSLADLQAYADAGVDRIIVLPWRKSKEALDGLRGFAKEVLEPARASGLVTEFVQ
jgi:probable F420-dependent oxidoreductase